MANPASLTVTAPVANGSVNQPAAQTIDTNGDVPITVGSPMNRMIIEAVNSAAADIAVTLKAGDNPPSHLSGDLAVTVVATSGKKIIGPFESQRFLKSDGTVVVNFQAASGSPNLAIRVYRLPKL